MNSLLYIMYVDDSGTPSLKDVVKYYVISGGHYKRFWFILCTKEHWIPEEQPEFVIEQLTKFFSE